MVSIKRQRAAQERSVYLRSPYGAIIFVPARRAQKLLKRTITLNSGAQGEYTALTEEEVEAITNGDAVQFGKRMQKFKEPYTSPDADILLVTHEESNDD